MEFLPKPVKMVLYGLTFILVLMGGSSAVSWFPMLGLGLVLYVVFRVVSMGCIHRYTGILMGLMVFVTGILNVKTPQTVGLLALGMLIDIFI